MLKIDLRRAVALLPVLLLASVAPNAFPAAQMGYATLRALALHMIIPAAAVLVMLVIASLWKGKGDIARVILAGAMAGAVATIALEAIRYPAFRLGLMPGNLPQLMGVLLMDRLAQGPSLASNVAGFAYHFWNGACFGVVFAALAELGMARRKPIWGIGYGVLIGLGFMASPVVKSLGVGLFGVDFGWHFAATVLAAHAAFGLVLALMLRTANACLLHAPGLAPAPKKRPSHAQRPPHAHRPSHARRPERLATPS